MTANLIDRIYECAFVPEHWPEVLDRLAQMIEAPRGTLVVHKKAISIVAASPDAIEAAKRTVNGGWLERGHTMARILGLRHSGFFSEYDLFTPEELDNEPLWRDHFRPAGFGWGAGTSIPLPSGDHVLLVITRQLARGPVGADQIQKLDGMRPHVGRAVLIGAQLQLQRASAVGEALALIGLPSLVLDEKGKVLAANSLIETLTDWVRWKALDKVSFKDRAADQLFRDAITTVRAGDSGNVRSFPVRDTRTGAIMVAHVVPIRLSARDIFVRCSAVLVLSPVSAPQAPSIELVQSLFDFTPAEARVARSLANGKTVNDIALDAHTSLNTVRSHVRGVLQKTGCARQTDVVAMLAGISSLQPNVLIESKRL
jgi:DNA-binding CsgD family transcriptional regulator